MASKREKNYISSAKSQIKKGNLITYKEIEDGDEYYGSALLLKQSTDTFSGMKEDFKSWSNTFGSFFYTFDYTKGEDEDGNSYAWNHTFPNLDNSFVSSFRLQDAIEDGISVFNYLVKKYENSLLEKEKEQIFSLLRHYSQLIGGYLLYNEKKKEIPSKFKELDNTSIYNWYFENEFLDKLTKNKEGAILSDESEEQGKTLSTYSFHDAGKLDISVLSFESGRGRYKKAEVIKIIINTFKSPKKENIQHIIDVCHEYDINTIEINDKSKGYYQDNEIEKMNTYFKTKSEDLENMSHSEMLIYLEILASFSYLGTDKLNFTNSLPKIVEFLLNNMANIKQNQKLLLRFTNLIKRFEYSDKIGITNMIKLLKCFEENKIKVSSLITRNVLENLLENKDFDNKLIEKYFERDNLYTAGGNNLDFELLRVLEVMESEKYIEELNFDIYKLIESKINEHIDIDKTDDIDIVRIISKLKEKNILENVSMNSIKDNTISLLNSNYYKAMNLLKSSGVEITDEECDYLLDNIEENKYGTYKLSEISSVVQMNLSDDKLLELIRLYENSNFLTGMDSYDEAIYKNGLDNEHMSNEMLNRLCKEAFQRFVDNQNEGLNSNEDLQYNRDIREIALLLRDEDKVDSLDDFNSKAFKTLYKNIEKIQLGGSGHSIEFKPKTIINRINSNIRKNKKSSVKNDK